MKILLDKKYKELIVRRSDLTRAVHKAKLQEFKITRLTELLTKIDKQLKLLPEKPKKEELIIIIKNIDDILNRFRIK